MKTEAFFVFLIILLGLILCLFLGTDFKFYCSKEGFNINNDASLNDTSVSYTIDATIQKTYDNYDHYNGSSSQITNETTFIAPNGNTATIITNSNGTQIIKITKIDDYNNPIIFVSSTNSNTFTSPDGSTATIVYNNGQKAIKITNQNGEIIFYTLSGSQPSDTLTSTQYYGSTGTPIQEAGYSLAYQPNNYNTSAGAVTGPQGNTAYYAQGPQGNTYTGISSGSNASAPSSYDYSNSLPQGIPASLIPPGKEDLYILKSEVVPPVCPVCPSSSVCPRQEKCPPCPACARCPEPSFECKKVPNYNAINNEYLPTPVLNDFSGFGM